jgi:LPS sulfotransferase NodH
VAGVPDEFFETLRATGLPRQARQYFEDPGVADIARQLPPSEPGRPEQRGDFEGWFTYALRRGTSHNGVFGAKMMGNYFDDLRDRVRELAGNGDLLFTEALDRVFPDLHLVFVRRRDKVSQAVSLWRAIQTQQWRNEVDPGHELPAEYDYRAIRHLVDELHRWDARSEDWFHATGREPIRVIDEDFGPMRPQADTLSQDWVSHFRHEDDTTRP